MEEERKKQLLMGLMDQELSPEESYEIQELLRRDQTLRDEYEQLMLSNDQLKLISEADFDETILRKLWRSPFNRGMRYLSYSLIGGGFLLLSGFGIWEWLQREDPKFLPIAAFAGVGTGIIILMMQVIRDRLKILKNDPYREIEK